ncbi:MAG: hypothetical protein ACK5H1_01310 [Tenacibaculum sp.]
MKKVYKKLLQQKGIFDKSSQSISLLQQKNIYLDSVLDRENISAHNSFQQALLKKLTDFTTNKELELITFNEPHVITENQVDQETYFFELKGGFIDILKAINYLEQQKMGALTSVNFQKNKNYKTNTAYLSAKIFIRKTSR